MSGIVLSAAVRQNLLSLQSTAELLSTTQNRLASGKKVNTALDNPTNFFTAQGLDNRASDINNLLDAIGNGVQVLQAANTGITSLQKLVDTARSIANQVLQTTVGYSPKSTVSSSAALGGTAANLVDGVTIKVGDLLTIASTGGGTPTSITFGANESLDQLNAALGPNNLSAGLDANNKLVITTLNDAASKTIGAVTYTNSGGGTVTFGAVNPPIADVNSQVTRANLVAQYNNIIAQITTTSQDASFNGINLLNGDDLKLTFNETGKSTLNIRGVTYDAAGLGLAPLTAGTDFLDNDSAKAVIAKISLASDVLRSEASSLGSNLSIVQIRQDFSKNLIIVLQTGSANLTLADSNEEAANSQALSTRQSIAVSALALSNQSQQSVLKLLQ
ncbi:MAG TPA: flagellin [Bradyrhizobium sp.]|jgi:flagellin-like hook-associated protein FlgL|nr:flagellin [Bradyrhizobium sp.]